MSSDDVMRLGKFDNNDITETLLDYCDCGGHGCEPCYAAEVIKRLRAEVERQRVGIDEIATALECERSVLAALVARDLRRLSAAHKEASREQ